MGSYGSKKNFLGGAVTSEEADDAEDEVELLILVSFFSIRKIVGKLELCFSFFLDLRGSSQFQLQELQEGVSFNCKNSSV